MIGFFAGLLVASAFVVLAAMLLFGEVLKKDN